MLVGGLVFAALLVIATVVRVYRGGTTLNDHFVAAIVVGCIGLYALLWIGVISVGFAGPALWGIGAALGAGAFGIYALFHVLDGRRDPGVGIWLGYWSQPAYAFALWAGLVLLLHAPFALWLDRPLLWPGWVLLIPLGLTVWGTLWTYVRHNTLTRHTITIPDLPHPLAIAHLSDLHACATMTRRDLTHLFERVNALEPDLVLITGDLVMPFSEQHHQFLIDELAALRAPTFACVGNHDIPIRAQLQAELAGVGVELLVDQTLDVDVDGTCVEIAGVDFHWKNARRELDRALGSMPEVPRAAARILMAHDPRLFSWLPTDRFHLVLSGHTHGGQVGTNMFGLRWSLLRLFGVHDQGFFRSGAAVQYVHAGNWHTGLPPRMGISGEIAMHRLVAGS